MANKAFEIQNSTLRIGGVDLQAGTTGVVIPGVTQAANYRVEEVEDTVDQTVTFTSAPTIIDAVTFSDYLTSGTSTGRATYTCELDGDGYIDNLQVDTVGSYNIGEANVNEASDMSAYTGASSDPFSPFVDTDWTAIPFRPKMRADNVESIGLPTVTIPEELGTNYKGLQVSYGVVHSNSSQNELNVNKIVIHKPAATTTTIDPTSNQDDFEVSGLGGSDVVALFVFYGDANGPKPLSTLQAFAEAAIDTVILVGGVEGQYNTVDDMKTAFYANYSTLAAAAGGLYTNFNFFSSDTNFTVANSTLVEGSGAVFDITGSGTDYTITPTTPGVNYKVGHKILIAGTDIGQSDTRWDLIVIVSAVDINGGITAATWELYIPGFYAVGSWTGVSGTNYQVGGGAAIYNLNYIMLDNTVQVSGFNPGSGYVVGDVLTILGTDITGAAGVLASPANNITVTITAVNGFGQAQTFSVAGTIPRPLEVWPVDNISDGGQDQYDNANYISTNLATNIPYNDGNTVVDGSAAFGAGSTYSFVYDTAIFGLFAAGSSATLIRTSGNSGADGSSITEAGNIYGPNTPGYTKDNAVTYINIVGNSYAGPEVSFVHTDGGNEVDILIPDDGDGAGVGITRSSNQGIYNPYREGGWNSSISPGGTLWNIDGWDDFSDVETRTYRPLYETFGSGGLGNKIVGAKCVMYLPDNGKYYTVEFSQWTQNGNGGGFAYTRRELNINTLKDGITFRDGTVLKSAAGVGRVKLESPGNRRIEEVHGYKQVLLTQVTQNVLTTTTSRAGTNEYAIWIDSTTTTIDDVLNNYTLAGIWDSNSIEFSLDNITWYKFNGGTSFNGNERAYGLNLPSGPLNYSAGATVWFRYNTGGQPVVWWDKADLPGGSSNFRGAIIQYHAFENNAGTMIGTIHMVNDSGQENVTHMEAFSGGSNGGSVDIWFQDNENQLKYRRIDGNGATLKIQWTAKVFYGSEFWD